MTDSPEDSARPPLPPEPLLLADTLSVPTGEVPGAAVLAEAPPEAAALLWHVFRSAQLWARGTGGPWMSSETMAAWEEEVLASPRELPLWSAAAVTIEQLGHPAEVEVETLAWALLGVNDWALMKEFPATAVAFAEVAAQVFPENPRYAYIAGVMLRNHGHVRDAARWFRRASRIARWQEDFEGQVLSLAKLGMLRWNQGRFPAARSILRRALRIARRHRLQERQAEVLHDLCAIAITAHDHEQAERYARQAFDTYPLGHHRLPALAYDIAYYWLTRGYAARALPIFRQLLPHFPEPHRRIQVLAALSRAGGVLGDAEAFEAARAEIGAIRPTLTNRCTLAAVLLDVGIGAAQLGRWSAAEEAFAAALDVAEEQAQPDLVLLAEESLGAAESRRLPAGQGDQRAVSAQHPAEQFAQRLDAAVGQLVPGGDHRAPACGSTRVSPIRP